MSSGIHKHIFRPWASLSESDPDVKNQEDYFKNSTPDTGGGYNFQKFENTNFETRPINEIQKPFYNLEDFSNRLRADYMAYDYASGIAPQFFDEWSDALLTYLPFTGDPNLDFFGPYLNSTNFNDICLATAAGASIPKLKQRPKKFKCPHCKVSFSNNGQLKGHVRIHTGERPFKCDVQKCGKSFTRNEELTRHKRIHTGLRPFPCDHCGKRFGRKDHLKKHARTHFPQRSPQYISFYHHPIYSNAIGLIPF